MSPAWGLLNFFSNPCYSASNASSELQPQIILTSAYVFKLFLFLISLILISEVVVACLTCIQT